MLNERGQKMGEVRCISDRKLTTGSLLSFNMNHLSAVGIKSCNNPSRLMTDGDVCEVFIVVLVWLRTCIPPYPSPP